MEIVISEQQPQKKRGLREEELLHPFPASFQAQLPAFQHGGIPSPVPCFWTKDTRVNSHTPHFPDKDKKLIKLNLLYISYKIAIQTGQRLLFFRGTDEIRINGACLSKQLQLNQCKLCPEKLYIGRQDDLTFQLILHFHLGYPPGICKVSAIAISSLSQLLRKLTLYNHFPTAGLPICPMEESPRGRPPTTSGTDVQPQPGTELCSSLVPRSYTYPMDYTLNHRKELIQVKTHIMKKTVLLKLVSFTHVVYFTIPNSSAVQDRR